MRQRQHQLDLFLPALVLLAKSAFEQVRAITLKLCVASPWRYLNITPHRIALSLKSITQY
jgi:hypothetical protein